MICPPCRKAGSLNAITEPGMPNVEKMIRAMHLTCPGGNWCDCQHFVGQALNLPLINAGKPAAATETKADVLEPVKASPAGAASLELCLWFRLSRFVMYADFRRVLPSLRKF